MYDADERQAALEPPTLKLNGVIYTGQCLSFDEGAALRDDFEKLRTAGADETIVRELAKKVFAQLGFEERVADELMRTKPFGVVFGVLADFSGALLGVKVRADAAPTPTPTPSASSEA